MFSRKDMLGCRDLSSNELMTILSTAKQMKEKIDNPLLRNSEFEKVSVVTLFFENSTRTRMSFFQAAEYIGAKIADLGVTTSSVQKGESLIDTGVNLDQMGVDIMVIRHSMTAAPHLLAKNVQASVINAGDGTNEHPTQALLDIFTIYERMGCPDNFDCFKNLKIAIIGDINHSRVARSNVFALNALGANLTLAGPSTLLSSSLKSLNVHTTNNIEKAVEGCDVVMGLRIQLERQKGGAFPDLREYSSIFGIDAKTLALAKPNVLLMHPGPVNRGVELSTDIIDGEHSVINMQVKNGVAVRMALLKLLADARKRRSA